MTNSEKANGLFMSDLARTTLDHIDRNNYVSSGGIALIYRVKTAEAKKAITELNKAGLIESFYPTGCNAFYPFWRRKK